MKITIVGTGYVGLVTGTGFAHLGHETTCIDVDEKKVKTVNAGISPIYEKGLAELLQEVLKKKTFHATTSFDLVKKSDAVFMCVGTPSGPDGSADLGFVESAAKAIGKCLRKTKKFVVVVVKSTVVPGTTNGLVRQVLERESGKKAGAGFGLAMFPEFLKEGTAVKDFFEPDRIVIGAADEKSKKILEQLSAAFNCPKLCTSPANAEMIKYASNAFLAARISLINEIANLCEKTGADAIEVAKGIGLDKRIGPYFLNAGAGFGGSCFPKDVKALRAFGERNGVRMRMLDALLKVNAEQPLRMLELATAASGAVENKKVCVLGLAFKPGTDDVREAPSLILVRELARRRCKIAAFDPKAMENAEKALDTPITYASSVENALKKAEICFIVTDWPEFKRPPELFKKLMAKPVVIDGRRLFDALEMKKAGIVYRTIGLGS